MSLKKKKKTKTPGLLDSRGDVSVRINNDQIFCLYVGKTKRFRQKMR